MTKSCDNYNYRHHHRHDDDDDDDDNHDDDDDDPHMFDANDNFSSGNNYPANKISGFIDDNKVNLNIFGL